MALINNEEFTVLYFWFKEVRILLVETMENQKMILLTI